VRQQVNPHLRTWPLLSTTVARCRERFPGSPVRYQAEDLLRPPAAWLDHVPALTGGRRPGPEVA
jgi:hypothetical protein